jgi:hypothetical protein
MRIKIFLNSAKASENKTSFKDRMSWAFSKKQKAKDMFDELEKCKSTFLVTFNIDLVYLSFISTAKIQPALAE